MASDEKLLANPVVQLREEFDDWALLFDPDKNIVMGLNPFAVFVWKLLDGKHTLDAILKEVRDQAEGVPYDAEDHIRAFVDALVAEGLAGIDRTEPGPIDGQERTHLRLEKSSYHPATEEGAEKRLAYEPPNLINLNGKESAYGSCMNVGSGDYNCNPTGHLATNGCNNGNGTTGTGTCGTGTSAAHNCGPGGSPGWDCLTGNVRIGGNCCDGSSGDSFSC